MTYSSRIFHKFENRTTEIEKCMSKVVLYPHNQEAYKKIEQSIANGNKKIAISHATGTGKSYLIAKLCEDYNFEKKLVLVPSKYIKENILKVLKECGIKNIHVKTYQWLIKIPDDVISEMDYKVIALDEYHHDTAKVWGDKVKTLINTHPQTIFFGTSATPVRTDGINTIDVIFDGNCVSELPLSKAIAKKIVPTPKYIAALYALDERLTELREKVEKSTNSKEEKEEFYNKINSMRSQIEKSYGMPIILNKHIKDKTGKFIIFCKNRKHLEEIKNTVIEWFKVAGFKNINTYVVHSSYEGKDREYQAFCSDTSDKLKLLFCVNMLNEGLHLKNISGVLLLRSTRSYIVLMQQIGRAIEASNSRTPIIIDAVNNFTYVKDGIKLLQEIKEELEKEEKSNKNFDKGYFLDIDTFFITEYVCDVEKMLSEIEDKLQNSINVDLLIEHLIKYKNRYGNMIVPIKYISEDGFKLGRMCQIMRSKKNGRCQGRGQVSYLSDEEFSKLNQIGFIWNNIDECWNKKFDLIKEYCDVCNLTINDIQKDTIYKNFKIGHWVKEQLRKIKNGEYENSYKKNLLLENGLVLDNEFYNWRKKYLEYISYLKKNNLKCNQISKNAVGELGTRLYNFEHTCKRKYKNGTLRDQKVELLKEYGFDFTFLRDEKINVFEEKIKKYLSNPNSSSSRNWIQKTKYRYNNEKLNNEEMQLLKKYNIVDNLGVFYVITNPYIAIYRHGQFLGKLYKSARDVEENSLKDLGRKINKKSIWSFCSGSYKNDTIYDFQFKYVTSRKDILDGVDKPFLNKNDLKYREKVEYLSKFYPEKILRSTVYEDFRLGDWLHGQRTKYKRGDLSDLRLSFFKELGVMSYLEPKMKEGE